MPRHVGACFSINTQGKIIIKKDTLGYHSLAPVTSGERQMGWDSQGIAVASDSPSSLPILTQLSTHSTDGPSWSEVLSHSFETVLIWG